MITCLHKIMIFVKMRTMKLLRILFAPVLALSFLSLPSCSNEGITVKGDSHFNKIIFAHTEGVVSKNSSISVQLFDAAGPADSIGIPSNSDLISLYPNVAGVTVWKDNRTLTFTPTEPLESNKKYTVQVNLKKIIDDLPGNIAYAKFDFMTKPIVFRIDPENVYVSESNDQLFDVSFRVTASDALDIEKVKELFKINSRDNNPAVESIDHYTYLFNYYNTPPETAIRLERTENGKTEKYTYTTPDLTFRIADTKIYHDGRTVIKLTFNRVLDKNQDLDGLIGLSGENIKPEYLKDRNIVYAYYPGNITGNRTLFAEQSIRSIQGNTLKEKYTANIEINSVNPQIDLIGTGYIIPTSNGIIFPFKTMNLQAVDIEIVKIFNNNILQYLQGYEDDYYLNKVGRIVYQNKISLEASSGRLMSANTWETHGLDLSDFISVNTDAIYQVRLGFRPNYVKGQDCNQEKFKDIKDLPLSQGDIEIKSFYDNNYYGLSGAWYEGFWENRDNPCEPAYYNAERFVKRNVVASNIGLMSKSVSGGKYHIFATSLLTGEPLAEVKIELFDYQQQLIETKFTNIHGEAVFSPVRKPGFVTASRSNDHSFMRLFDGEGLSLTRFDVAGTISRDGMKGFLFAERDVWRPGDTIFMNLIAENQPKELPNNYPLDVTLQDPLGRTLVKKTFFKQEINLYSFPLALPADAVTGEWWLTVSLGGNVFSRTVMVETIKPNRFELTLDLPEKIYRSETIYPKATIEWLNGAKAAGNRITVEKNLRPARFIPAGYRDYTFGNPGQHFNVSPEICADKNLNAEGQAEIPVSFDKIVQPPSVIDARYNIKVFEGNGNFSTFNRAARYYPYDNYIGLKMPKDSYNYDYLREEKPNDISFVVIDSKERPVANKKVKIKIYLNRNHYWWSREQQDLGGFIQSYGLTSIEEYEVATNATGEGKITFTPPTWGSYIISAASDENTCTSYHQVYAGYYLEEGKSKKKGPVFLHAGNTKSEYSIGEEIEILVPADQNGNFLVTIENNKGLVHRFWQKAGKGDNTIKFRADKTMTPGIYVNIYYYQPHNTVLNDHPLRMYSVVPLQIIDKSRQLNVIVETPERVEPGKTMNISVSEAGKKNMAYVIAVVDEGLLSLTNFKTPDPFEFFNRKEALTTTTWDNYDDVLGAYGSTLSKVFGVGGDSAIELMNENVEESRFPPIVKFLGPFRYNGRTGQHSFVLPNYVGKVRVMVIASDQYAFGSSGKNVQVTSPLMILSTLPRQLSPEVDFTIPVNIFTDELKDKTITVSVQDKSGLISFPDGSTKNIEVGKSDKKTVTFSAKANGTEGNANIIIKAVSSSVSAEEDIKIRIKNPNPVLRKKHYHLIRAGESVTLQLDKFGEDPAYAQHALDLSTVVPFGIKSWTDELIEYPHGCLEQITSGAFGQLLLPSYVPLSQEGMKKVSTHVQHTIDQLRYYTTIEGGFGYWPGASAIDHWSSSYAGEFLIEAEKRGYSVPSNLLKNWINNQSKLARNWSNATNTKDDFTNVQNQMVQAYRLYTLALAGKAETGAMNRLRESAQLKNQAAILLSMAYSANGNKSVARELLQRIQNYNFEDYDNSYGLTYGSSLRDLALLLQAYLLADDMTNATRIIEIINNTLANNSWASTQTKGQLLKAFERFTKSGKAENINIDLSVSGEQKTTVNEKSTSFSIVYPMTRYEGRSVTVTNNNTSPVILTQTISGKESTGKKDREPVSQNSFIDLKIRYTDLNGQPVNISRLKSGEEFVAELEVTNKAPFTAPLKELALTYNIPDGWEFVNQRMNTGLPLEGSRYNHADIRDNKINIYFNLDHNRKAVFRSRLIASFKGDFFLPASQCESMYLSSVFAVTGGKWVSVN